MKQSAGLLVYRQRNVTEVFLVHPGGPYWKEKDGGAWSIPKGELMDGEDVLEAAKREFKEETGQQVEGEFIPLTPVKQKAGKLIIAWAVEGEVDVDALVSNTFQLEWPYKSGRWITVPEIDKGQWFTTIEAEEKINPGQALLLTELMKKIGNEASL